MRPATNTGFLAAAAGLPAQLAYGAKMIRHGGFEMPIVVTGSYRIFSTGDAFAG